MFLQKQQLILYIALVIGLTVAFKPQQKARLEGAWRLTEPSGAVVMLTVADNYLIQTVYEPICQYAGRSLPAGGQSVKPDGGVRYAR